MVRDLAGRLERLAARRAGAAVLAVAALGVRAGAFALAAVLPLAAWTIVNGLRYDEWALARGGNAVIPFYRAFLTDRIVSPEHGPESRRLGEAVERHLLT